MRTITSRQIASREIQTAVVIRDVVFHKCSFDSCALSDRIAGPDQAATLQNVTFDRCSFDKNCSVGNVVLEDVNLTSCKTSGLLFCRGALLNRVTMSGDCGRFSVSFNTHERGVAGGGVLTADQIATFDAARGRFYETVEWALDIRTARFKEFDMDDSVPAQAVRVNNVDQVVVDVGRIDKAALPAMDRLTGAFRSMIRMAGEDVVLVAAMLNKRRAEQELRAIAFLQTEGFTVG